LVDSSPRPIAASHVLHRLLVPRHPPIALSNLTTKMLASTMHFSNNTHPRVARSALPISLPRCRLRTNAGMPWKTTAARLFSQDSTGCIQPVPPLTQLAPTARGGGLLRKEVIQPHLPVRLPCYDFVPIASPTFDGSLPKGLGHRLRVLPTFVT
jgi:hypothetical protein